MLTCFYVVVPSGLFLGLTLAGTFRGPFERSGAAQIGAMWWRRACRYVCIIEDIKCSSGLAIFERRILISAVYLSA